MKKLRYKWLLSYMKNEIIVVGMLSDETYKKRQKHCRRVLSTEGLCVALTAGMGMGGV